MVVRLDLEDRGKAVTNVDRTRVFPVPQHARAGGRKRCQVNARAFIAAVLRPHHREDAELGQRRLAPEGFDDSLIFVSGETVLGDEFAGHGQRSQSSFETAFTADSKSTRPSALPTASSQARSG